MLRLCATHVVTLRYPCCDFARPMLRLSATHVATLRDPCCDFARPIFSHVAALRDPCCGFARPMLRFCATQASKYRISVAESPFRRPNSVAIWVADLVPDDLLSFQWRYDLIHSLISEECILQDRVCLWENNLTLSSCSTILSCLKLRFVKVLATD